MCRSSRLRSAKPKQSVLVLAARTPEDLRDLQALLSSQRLSASDCETIILRTDLIYGDWHEVLDAHTEGSDPTLDISGSILGRSLAPYYSGLPWRRGLRVCVLGMRLAYLLRRAQSSTVLASPSTSYVRLARILAPRQAYVIGYFRSAFPLVDRTWSLADQFGAMVSRLSPKLANRIDPYAVDVALTAGTRTRDDLRKRMPPSVPVYCIGPGSLQVNSGGPHACRDLTERPEIIVVTQAFNAHGEHRAAEEQIAYFADLVEVARANGYGVSLRAHPRDDTPWADVLPAEIDLRVGAPSEFLARLRPGRDVLVGLTSTLLFEYAYLGGHAYCFASEHSVQENRPFLERCGISPFTDASQLLNSIQAGIDMLDSSKAGVLSIPEVRVTMTPTGPSISRAPGGG